MGNYVNYSYYEINYLQGREAVIPSTSFNFYEKRAEIELKNRTHNTLIDINEAVQDCICELSEFFYREDMEEKAIANSAIKGVSSESVGEYSVSYSTSKSSEYTLNNREVKITSIIKYWLGDRALMNRGVDVVY